MSSQTRKALISIYRYISEAHVVNLVPIRHGMRHLSSCSGMVSKTVHVVNSDTTSKFVPRTLEIHIFRIQAPFSTFFISTRRSDHTLQLSFRLCRLILVLTFIILFLVGRDRKTPL